MDTEGSEVRVWIKKPFVLDIEKGAVPNLETADKLCRALHIVFMIGKGD